MFKHSKDSPIHSVMSGVDLELEKSQIVDRYLIKKTIRNVGRVPIFLASDLKTPHTEVLIRKFVLNKPIEHLESVLKCYQSLPPTCGAYLYDYELGHHHVVLVTPYVNRLSLSKFLKMESLSELQILSLAESIFKILKEYELRGIKHSQINPKNIFMTPKGDGQYTYTLNNFQLAFETSADVSPHELNFEDIVYVSPEQAGLLRQETHIRSDFYSLGVVLYETCLGRPLLREDKLTLNLQNKLRSPFPSLRLQRKDLHPALDAFISRLLYKAPQDRYQSVDAVLHDLKEIQNHLDSRLFTSLGQKDLRTTLCPPTYLYPEDVFTSLESLFEKTKQGQGKSVCLYGLPGEGRSKVLEELKKSCPTDVKCLLLSCSVKQDMDLLKHSIGHKDSPLLILCDDAEKMDKETYNTIKNWTHLEYTSLLFSISSLASHSPFDFASESYTLKPFTKAQTQIFLQSMAGPLSDKIVDTIYHISNGNPFFTEALIRGLEETHILFSNQDVWELDSSQLSTAHISNEDGNTQAIRMMQSDAKIQDVLKFASLFRGKISLIKLIHLSEMDESSVKEAISYAKQSHFIMFIDDIDHFYFTHESIREALRNSLSNDEKLNIHKGIVTELLKNKETDDEDLSYHLSQAKEFSQAFPYAFRAAKNALKSQNLSAASVQFKIARAGIPTNEDSLKYVIAFELGSLYLKQKHYEAAKIELQRAETYSKTRLEKAEVFSKLGNLEFEKGNFEVSSSYFLQGIKQFSIFIPEKTITLVLFLAYEILFRQVYLIFLKIPKIKNWIKTHFHENKALKTHLFEQLSFNRCFQNNRLSAAWASFYNLKLAELYGDASDLIRTYDTHAQVFSRIGYFERAIEFSKKALELGKAHNDENMTANSLHSLGLSCYFSGRFDEALDYLNQADVIFVKRNDAKNLRVKYLIGMSLYRLGDLKKAYDFSQNLFELASYKDNLTASISLNIQVLSCKHSIDFNQFEKSTQNFKNYDIALLIYFHTQAVTHLRKKQYKKGWESLQSLWTLVNTLGIYSEAVSSAAVWEMNLLRQWYSDTPIEQYELRSYIFENLTIAINRSKFYVKVFKNNLPMHLRELGFYFLLCKKPIKAKFYLNKSLQIAHNMGAAFEAALTENILETMTQSSSNLEKRVLHFQSNLSLVEAMQYSDSIKSEVTLSLMDRFDLLLEVGKNITQSLTEEDVYKNIGLAIESLLRSKNFAILSFDKEHGVYSYLFGPFNTQFNENYLTKTLAERHSKIFSWEDQNTKIKQSVLCVPIHVHESIELCIYVVNDDSYALFDKEELGLADFISTLAGTALENSKSFQKVELLTQSLEKDIEERKKDQLKLQELLKEKELILREVFHRTKNNMQIITSMLNLQTINDNMSIKDIIKECQNRIFSISLVHDKLIHSEDISTISLAPYIHDLVDGLKKSYFSISNKVDFDINVDDSIISIDHAVPCGLIINEILTNSLKYAFPQDEDCSIKIDMRKIKESHEFKLIVADNGIGIPDDFNLLHTHSLGMKLIVELARVQLHGHVSISKDHGTKFTITFPYTQYSRRF